MEFSKLCEKYFGSKDLYEILKISKQASEVEVRKAYHRLSLSCHPDRVAEDHKVEANERFKVLGKIHSILSDPEKRTIYDETGKWHNDDDETPFGDRDWVNYWHLCFKQVTLDDIKKYEQEYKGSDEELSDLKKAYMSWQGDWDKIYECVPFITLEEEDRVRGRLQQLIDNHEIPLYDNFVNEPKVKRDRRMRKLRKEAKEAEEETKKKKEKEESVPGDLQKAILARRQESSDSFLTALEKKYAGPKMSSKTHKKSSRGKAKE